MLSGSGVQVPLERSTLRIFLVQDMIHFLQFHAVASAEGRLLAAEAIIRS